MKEISEIFRRHDQEAKQEVVDMFYQELAKSNLVEMITDEEWGSKHHIYFYFDQVQMQISLFFDTNGAKIKTANSEDFSKWLENLSRVWPLLDSFQADPSWPQLKIKQQEFYIKAKKEQSAQQNQDLGQMGFYENLITKFKQYNG